MGQGLFPYQYRQGGRATTTGLAGLLPYMELMHAAGLGRQVDRKVGLRTDSQGWTDSQVVNSLVLLNLAGGEAMSDLDVLEGDPGLRRVLGRIETLGMGGRKRTAIKKRWRIERSRSVPSDSAAARYLARFHDREQEAGRQEGKAFIPAPGDALRGLYEVNADLIRFIQDHSPQPVATLDMDATLVETHKREAFHCYRNHRAYQPLTAYWFEADLIVHSEFRDGNVPAGYEQLRVLRQALCSLPEGVERVMLRSDTAGYQRELLRYCAEGADERFGVIEFAVGVDVTPQFRSAVSEVADEDWMPLYRRVGEHMVDTGQQWAEVNFVPAWTAHSRNSPDYRYLAIREPMTGQPPDRQVQLPFPSMEMPGRGWHKIFGVVTNRDLPGDQVIRWSRQRCGKGEEVHGVLKSDLAGGKLPSGLFGANAAWWAIAVLAANLNTAMKRLVLGGEWTSRRLKALRFALIGTAARVATHARGLTIRLPNGHPAYGHLLRSRRRIWHLAAGLSPP